MKAHIEGRPVSVRTYGHYGCRCPDCTAANTAAQRRARAARGGALWRVERKQRHLAAAWVSENRPGLWEQFRQQAYDELGIERRSPGPQRVAS